MIFDTSQLGRLSADLTRAPANVQRAAWPAFMQSADRLAKDAAQRISGHPHAPAYPKSITADINTRGLLGIEADVGPDKGLRQGALGNILEYGTSKNAPIPHLGPALDAEAPKLERVMTLLAARGI